MAVDVRKAIVASLFPPQAPEVYISHVQTFEGAIGSPERKERYLLLSATRQGGRLRLHKSKQNSNGTFSIGKSWNADDLRSIEVSNRQAPGRPKPEPLSFTLVINGKSYAYDTEPPSAAQASFLVNLVRNWRRSQEGRNVPDLTLVGFMVDSPPTPVLAASTSNGQQAHAAPQPQQRPPPQSLPPGAGHQSRSSLSNSSSSRRQPSFSSGMSPPGPSGPRPSAASLHSNYGPTQRPSDASLHVASIGSAASTPSHSAVPPPAGPRRQPSSSTPLSAELEAPPSRASGARSITPDNRSTTSSAVNGERPPPAARPPPPAQTMSSDSMRPPPSRSRSGDDVQPDSREARVKREPPEPAAPPPRATPSPTKPRSATVTSAATAKTGASRATASSAVSGGADDDADTVLANVEEMLEGFEWRGNVASSGWSASKLSGSVGKADEIEKRLVGELKALEAASIHAILESDDRVNHVLGHLDEALAELDRMDQMIGLYKSQLNLMTDDIDHIEGQNRGLQVQASNQRALLTEIDGLIETINIPERDLRALTQESLESPAGIERLEHAAVSLYKALLNMRDNAVGDMAATNANVVEYRTKADQFAKRMFDFLSIMFKYQADSHLNDKAAQVARAEGTLLPHVALEDDLGRYCGLMLFVKEIEPTRYAQICSAYFSTMRDLHSKEMRETTLAMRNMVRRPTEEDLEATFSSGSGSPILRSGTLKRVGTTVRSGDSGSKKDSGKIVAGEAFWRGIDQITEQVIREQRFISDFLNVSSIDETITFADYMGIEAYFRRNAMAWLSAHSAEHITVRSAMDKIFSYLSDSTVEWIDTVIHRDGLQIVGVLAALDRGIRTAEDKSNEFLLRMFDRAYSMASAILNRALDEQVKAIEQTRITLKKRKGVVPFVRVFPFFVFRLEAQLAPFEEADELPVREVVNGAYDRVVSSMMDGLQQMAKMSGEAMGPSGEDKDQLNYHVILIENMHHLTVELGKLNVPSLQPHIGLAQDKYDDSLAQYINMVLRRPLGRLMEYFDALEAALRSSNPREVARRPAYSRSSLRRALSSTGAKDLRKGIDTLYKRVDKHFGSAENPSAEHALMIRTVWKACEVEVLRMHDSWRSMISRCYPDDNKSSLEFSKEDVTADFKRAQL